MNKLLTLLALLFACSYPTSSEPVQPTERTFWSVCWSEEGEIQVPKDFEFVNNKCENPKPLVWKLPIKIGYPGVRDYYHVFIRRAMLVWNNQVGINLFVINHENPDVTVKPVPNNPFAYAYVDINKNPTLTGEVKVGLNTWNDPRLYFTLVHEFGHILGLAHDKCKDSWMFGGTRSTDINITSPDIKALRKLYGQ